MNILGILQRLGRSLQLSIVVLPVAALLMRFGQPDLLDFSWMAKAGSVVFEQLPLLFAITVASTWSKGNTGTAALAGTVAYFIFTSALNGLNPALNLGTLGGILMGLLAGFAYDRWHQTVLPEFLSFFGGKRFVPIMAGLLALLSALLCSWIWPPIQALIERGNHWLMTQGGLGVATYGMLNRLLIPTGLHQILNTFTWFQCGSFTDATGAVVQGDIARFFAGDLTAGRFMAGFYPIMMFGLPAAAFAMYIAAPKSERQKVGGLLFSLGFTSFLTGVTEPLEFLFMFLAPALYLIHALLTGLMLAIAYWLDIHAGFTFSAGAIDFLLMFSLPAASPNVWWLLFPLGIGYAILYFFIFLVCIRVLNLATPGRQPADAKPLETVPEDPELQGKHYVMALGGAENITAITACISRLRLSVKNMGHINEAQLQQLGALGIVKLDDTNLQVVIGTRAEEVAETISSYLKTHSA